MKTSINLIKVGNGKKWNTVDNTYNGDIQLSFTKSNKKNLHISRVD